ncbi:unnamed protein product [Toxocara canis]|uniref:Uncharacterized protein n=1 Tax=Toxocara canis TaxID=6265 RepID=A0A183UJ84_TOXCA|nr:unnamed protein product [Toxocara canis]
MDAQHEEDDYEFNYYKIYLKFAAYTMAALYLFSGIRKVSFRLDEWNAPKYCIFCLISQSDFMCYIVSCFATFAVNVQLVLEEGSFDFSAWRECVLATALLVANIYCFLLSMVVIQMVYIQHLMIVEQQVTTPLRRSMQFQVAGDNVGGPWQRFTALLTRPRRDREDEDVAELRRREDLPLV